MDTNEKKIFVYELCNAIAAGIVANIDAGKIPEEWDGFPLRQLVADHACTPYQMTKKQREEYRNTVAINNL